jgi:hypothetical protein
MERGIDPCVTAGETAPKPKGNPMDTVNSTSDGRTVNNAVRHQYRVLSDAEKALMTEVKDMGAAFIAKLHEIGGTDAKGDRFASRDLSIANTAIEDAVMRAVRHITA